MTIEELKIVISAEVANLRKGMSDAKAKLREVSQEADNTRESVDAIGDSRVDNLTDKLAAAKQDLTEMKERAAQLNAELAQLNEELLIYTKVRDQAVSTAESDFYQKWIDDVLARMDVVRGNLEETNGDIIRQQGEIKKLAKEYNNAANSATKTAKATNSIQKALNGVINIFKRMVIRKIINTILSDISECIELLARFDKAQNNLHGYNTALSTLKSEFKQLSADITVALMNLLVTIEPILVPIINAVQWLVEGFSKLFAILQGKSTYTRANPDYWKDYAASLEESDTTAKKLRKTIASFDELNVLNSNEDSSNPSASITQPGELFEEVPAEWGLDTTVAAALGLAALAKVIADVINAVKNLTNAFRGKNTVLAVQNGLEDTSLATLGEYSLALAGATAAVAAFAYQWQYGWSLIGEVIKDLGIGLTTAMAMVLGVPAQVAIPIGLVVAAVSSLAIAIHDNWDSIKQWSIETFNNISNTVSNWAGETWNTITNWVSNTGFSFSNWARQLGETIGNWATNTGATILSWSLSVLDTIKQWSLNTSSNVNEWASNTFNRVSQWSSNVLDKVGEWAGSFGETLATSFENNKQKVVAWCLATAISFASWASNIGSNIGAGMESMVENIGTGLEAAFENIQSWASSALETLTSWASSAGSAISGWASGIVSSVASGLSSAWSNVRNFFSSVTAAFNSGDANRGPSLIDRLKTTAVTFGAVMSMTAGAFVKKLFSKFIPTTSVPAFANGGVVSSPTLGLIGEYSGARNNPEIVAPQSMIKEIIDGSNAELANVYTQIGRQIISAIENKELSVSIGDDAIANAAARGNQSYYRRTGKPLITT